MRRAEQGARGRLGRRQPAGLQSVLLETKLVPCAGGQGAACGADGDAASADSEAGLAEELEASDDEGCGAAGPAAAAAAGAPGLPAAAHPQGAGSPAVEYTWLESDIYKLMDVPYFPGTIAQWCTMPGADLQTLARLLVDAQRHCGGDNIFTGKGEDEVLAALPALISFAAQLEEFEPGAQVFWNIAQTTKGGAGGEYVLVNTPGGWFTQHNMRLELHALCVAVGRRIILIASNANPCPTQVQPRRRCPVPVDLLLPACTELGSGLRTCP